MELSAKGQAIFLLLFGLAALAFGLFNAYSVQSYRKTSVAVPAEIVQRDGLMSATLKFAKPDGRVVEEKVKAYYLGYDRGERVTVRLSTLDDRAPARVDNFLTNWALVILAGWVTLCMAYVGIANLRG